MDKEGQVRGCGGGDKKKKESDQVVVVVLHVDLEMLAQHTTLDLEKNKDDYKEHGDEH